MISPIPLSKKRRGSVREKERVNEREERRRWRERAGWGRRMEAVEGIMN